MERLTILPQAWRDALVRLTRKLPVSHAYASVDFRASNSSRARASRRRSVSSWTEGLRERPAGALLSPDVRDAFANDPFEDIINYCARAGWCAISSECCTCA